MATFIAQANNNIAIVNGLLQSANLNGQFNNGMVVQSAGNVKNLYIQTQDPTGSETVTATLYKNGAASALTCVVTSPAISAADVTHTVAVVAGDILTLHLVKSGGSASVSVLSNVELELA